MDDGITLALQQIGSAQQSMQADVSAMRSQLSTAITRLEVMDGWRAAADKQATDHETRLRLLERFRYTLVGISVVVGVIEGAIGYWIGHVIK